jgi:hypothetical protein
LTVKEVVCIKNSHPRSFLIAFHVVGFLNLPPTYMFGYLYMELIAKNYTCYGKGMASNNHISTHKNCIDLQHSSRSQKMNVTSIPSCQCCQFYHGVNQVVCGPHPYGPDSETCSDYMPKVSSLNQDQSSRDRWSNQPCPNWKFWQQFLLMVLGILVGVLGSGCLAVWLTTYDPTAPTTKTISKSEWVR